MIDYMAILGEFFPEVTVECFGDSTVYENIVLVSGDPIPSKEILEAKYLNNFRTKRILYLSEACENEIIGGFSSNALGEEYIYDSEQVDQLNIAGSVAATAPMPGYPEGISSYYAARKATGDPRPPKAYYMHTHMQLRKVIADGITFKATRLMKFNDKRNYIQNTPNLTLEQIEAVTWTSTEPMVG